RVARSASAATTPHGVVSPCAPISQPKHARHRGLVLGTGGAGFGLAQTFCAHTPPSGQSVSAAHRGVAAAVAVSGGPTGPPPPSAQDLGGASPGRCGNWPVIDALMVPLFGFGGAPPMATRLSYLLRAIVK